jgi:predicted acetyltransferase
MPEITVAAPADVDEFRAFLPVHRRTYLMSPEDGETWAGKVDLENFRIAKRGDRMIGGLTLRPMGQWFGGRAVPMTGIAAVGIEPQERASGAGTRFMRTILEELHASGVPISSLYPATQTIYRRCGYELAGDFIRYGINADEIDTRDRSLRIEHTTGRDAIISLYNERAPRTSGVLDRSPVMWDRTFEPFKSEADAYLVHGDERPEGYIVYSRQRGEHVRAHMIADVVALTPAAAKRILTFVVDHKSFIDDLQWNGPPADPFAFLLAEPRRKVKMSWPWMLRIVDVSRALSERGYPVAVEAELHLRVHDDVLGANDGAFVLRIGDGKAEVAPGGDGRLRIDVRGLASLYTGYASAHELLATGYIEGEEQDLLTADAIFAGPAPWLADFF